MVHSLYDYYVGHCSLSKVDLIYIASGKLTLLPSSDGYYTVIFLTFFYSGSNRLDWTWIFFNTTLAYLPLNHWDGQGIDSVMTIYVTHSIIPYLTVGEATSRIGWMRTCLDVLMDINSFIFWVILLMLFADNFRLLQLCSVSYAILDLDISPTLAWPYVQCSWSLAIILNRNTYIKLFEYLIQLCDVDALNS
jgi:hypothetical protein